MKRIRATPGTPAWGMAVLLLLLSPVMLGQGQPEVGIVEKLGQTVPLDVQFYDETGQPVVLGNLMDKPTIFTFVYLRCPGICTPMLNELARIVGKLDMELGKDYQIISLSFDPDEKPDLAADKKENYLGSIGKPVNPAGWRFLTGDSANIRKLTDAAGFYYRRDKDAWLHATALIVLSPSGKITRYMNGITFLPLDVKMALLEASNGRIGPTIANVLRFCYSYDPESHTYALNVARISMVVILILVAIFVIVFLVIPRMKNVGSMVKDGRSNGT